METERKILCIHEKFGHGKCGKISIGGKVSLRRISGYQIPALISKCLYLYLTAYEG